MITSAILGSLMLLSLGCAVHAWRKSNAIWLVLLAFASLGLTISFVDHTFYNGEILNFIVQWVNSFDQPQQ